MNGLDSISWRPSLGADEPRGRLDEGHQFNNEFLGMTHEACGEWLREHWREMSWYINPSFVVVIADARSTRDHSVTVFLFVEANEVFPYSEFEGFLPAEGGDKWYSWRVQGEHSERAARTLSGFVSYDCWQPEYFGRKAEFTDAQGIFDVVAAERSINPKFEPSPELLIARPRLS